MESAPPGPTLAALLARPPAGVTVRQGLDRVEIRLVRVPWTRGWRLRAPPSSPAAPWYRRPAPVMFLALYALAVVVLSLAWGSFSTALATISAVILAFLAFGGMIWACLEVLLLILAGLAEAVQALRPQRVGLTAQRFDVADSGRNYAFDLDSVRSIRAAPWAEREGIPRGSWPGALEVLTRDGASTLLEGAQLADLGWLANALQLAVNQRKQALIAAGHDLSRPPAEAEAARAMAALAGERRGSGV